MIGKIIGRIYIKREKEASRLRLGGGSWTIKLEELEAGELDTIQYLTESAMYQISYQDAVCFGFERLLGGERKLVVPVKYWSVKRRNSLAALD